MNDHAKNALHQAWFPTQAHSPPVDGLTTLRQALIAMEGGLPLDSRTAAHLRAAFRAFLYEGKSDLTANLGLRPGKGRKCEAPLRLERMTRRDALALAAERGGTGATATLHALADSIQDRLKAQRLATAEATAGELNELQGLRDEYAAIAGSAAPGR